MVRTTEDPYQVGGEDVDLVYQYQDSIKRNKEIAMILELDTKLSNLSYICGLTLEARVLTYTLIARSCKNRPADIEVPVTHFSDPRIKEITGLDDKQLKRAVKQLKKLKLLSTSEHKHFPTSTVYRMDFQRLGKIGAACKKTKRKALNTPEGLLELSKSLKKQD